MTRPPRLARLLIRLTAPPSWRAAQLGDLQEELEERAATPEGGAHRWYWRQALGSVVPNLAYRLGRKGRPGPHRRGEGRMEKLLQDLRFAVRSARRNPAFSAVVVFTLALGIGATTTIFGAVWGLVLDPFPFPHPDRIVGVGTAFPRVGADLDFVESLSPAEWEDVKDGSRTLQDVVAWDMGNRQIAGEGPPQNVFSGFWWGDALRTLAMKAYLGRGFTADETRTGAAVAMVSHRIWRSRFGADSSLVGRTILVNDAPYTVVGVLPEGVELYGMDLWIPMTLSPDRFPRDRRQFQILARVREGFGLDDVDADLAAVARRTEEAHGREMEEYRGWSLRALPLSQVVSGASGPAPS